MGSKTKVPEEQRAREFILQVLNETPKPLSTFEIFDEGERGDPPLRQGYIRRAIWNMVDAGELVFTADRCLAEARPD